ncbi:MAG: Prenyltransferase and squalene oxidase repeat protein [Planctomycetes bacterium ADurb.Bin126]|nr:MAG: Prenyltransferase and squalene oxidase repeat protein [Planctomycetes bacterium ADurb.Bin126]HOD84285.1 prenyltransferase/squalene oxidase repeat-containing protein [Phycisphaerae bacterium]HQL73454.1 prenyltransferase/squalene oxidase repeat-containing protein [Phycisphaerae bacterium]
MRQTRKAWSAWAVVLAVATTSLLGGAWSRSAAAAPPPGPVPPDLMDRRTMAAIERGLNRLKHTQRPDGSWMHDGSYGSYPSVMTALSGLAFMAGGSTPETGPYCSNVTKALNYILRITEMNKDGLIAGPGAEHRSMYGHGFSMLFLAQCSGVELHKDKDKQVREVLARAVKVTERSQSTVGGGKWPKPCGGWYYTPESNNDEGSVTVTQLQALRACRNVGVLVDKKVIDKAVEYLHMCQQPDGGICYSASSRGQSRPAISAAAIACFYAAGVYDRTTGGKGGEAEMVEKLVQYVQQNVRVDNQNYGHYFYTHFYMAQAMYQRGGKDWAQYYPQIRDRLLTMQAPDGSWNGDGVGTTYGTAIATIILQLPYGYLPICQK